MSGTNNNQNPSNMTTYVNRFNLFKNPGSNFRGQATPPGYEGTEGYNELTMRRKAEVLKHKQPGNELTKKQRLSMISRGKGRRLPNTASQNQISTNPNTRPFTPGSTDPYAYKPIYKEGTDDKVIIGLTAPNINSNAVVARPSSGSGVPGNKPLYYDKEVPLINYKVTRQYPSDFSGDNDPKQILGYFPGVDPPDTATLYGIEDAKRDTYVDLSYSFGTNAQNCIANCTFDYNDINHNGSLQPLSIMGVYSQDPSDNNSPSVTATITLPNNDTSFNLTTVSSKVANWTFGENIFDNIKGNVNVDINSEDMVTKFGFVPYAKNTSFYINTIHPDMTLTIDPSLSVLSGDIIDICMNFSKEDMDKNTGVPKVRIEQPDGTPDDHTLNWIDSLDAAHVSYQIPNGSMKTNIGTELYYILSGITDNSSLKGLNGAPVHGWHDEYFTVRNPVFNYGIDVLHGETGSGIRGGNYIELTLNTERDVSAIPIHDVSLNIKYEVSTAGQQNWTHPDLSYAVNDSSYNYDLCWNEMRTQAALPDNPYNDTSGQIFIQRVPSDSSFVINWDNSGNFICANGDKFDLSGDKVFSINHGLIDISCSTTGVFQNPSSGSLGYTKNYPIDFSFNASKKIDPASYKDSIPVVNGILKDISYIDLSSGPIATTMTAKFYPDSSYAEAQVLIESNTFKTYNTTDELSYNNLQSNVINFIFDQIPPVLSSVDLSSNNGISYNNVSYAKAGSEIYIIIDANEDISFNNLDFCQPSLGLTWSLDHTGYNRDYTITSTINPNAPANHVLDGSNVMLNITHYVDKALNEGSDVTDTTNNSSVIIYTKDPSINYVDISSNNPSQPSRACFDETVTVDFFSDHDLRDISGMVSFDISNDPVASDRIYTRMIDPYRNKWRSSFVVIDGEYGDVSFNIQNVEDLAGNGPVSRNTTTNGSSVLVKTLKLIQVGISSNNINPSEAEEGDIITLSIAADEDLAHAPDVSFALGTNHVVKPNEVTISGSGMNWDASFVVLDIADYKGAIDFLIYNYFNNNGHTGPSVSQTTNNSSVTITSKPKILVTTISSNNTYNTSYATTNNIVKLEITVDEVVEDMKASFSINGIPINSNRIIGGAAGYITGGAGTQWHTSFAVNAGENGPVTFSVFDYKDFQLPPNTGDPQNTTTNSSSVTVDTTKPTITALGIQSNNSYNLSYAKANDIVTLEAVTDVPIFDLSASFDINGTQINNNRITISGTGTQWSAAFTVNDGENGPVTFDVFDYKDIAGNIGDSQSTTTNSSSVTVDTTKPTVTLATISTNNASNTQVAYPGDTVTLDIKTSESVTNMSASFDISAVPLPSNRITLSGSGSAYAASFVTQAGENGAVTFDISNYEDLAGNIGINRTTTTNSSNVMVSATSPPTLQIASYGVGIYSMEVLWNTTPNGFTITNYRYDVSSNGSFTSSYTEFNPAITDTNDVSYNFTNISLDKRQWKIQPMTSQLNGTAETTQVLYPGIPYLDLKWQDWGSYFLGWNSGAGSGNDYGYIPFNANGTPMNTLYLYTGNGGSPVPYSATVTYGGTATPAPSNNPPFPTPTITSITISGLSNNIVGYSGDTRDWSLLNRTYYLKDTGNDPPPVIDFASSQMASDSSGMPMFDFYSNIDYIDLSTDTSKILRGDALPPYPAQPVQLAATGSSSSQIAISWNVISGPSGNGGSPITHFEYSTNNGSSWSSTGSTSLSHTISGLSANTTYTIRVRAVNINGAGGASASKAALTYPPNLTVSPSISVSNQSSTVDLTGFWPNSVPPNSGSLTYDWEFYYDGPPGYFDSSGNTTNTNVTHTSTNYGAWPWAIRVRTRNSTGTSDWAISSWNS